MFQCSNVPKLSIKSYALIMPRVYIFFMFFVFKKIMEHWNRFDGNITLSMLLGCSKKMFQTCSKKFLEHNIHT